MTGNLIIGLTLPPLMGWVLYNLLAPARAVWRGNASAVPIVPKVQPSQRTYIPYLLWTTPLFGGCGLLGLAGLLLTVLPRNWPSLALGVVGIALMVVVGPVFVLVHLFACLFNRPRFLITPVCRHQPGWVELMRRRRRRNRRRVAQPRQ